MRRRQVWMMREAERARLLMPPVGVSHEKGQGQGRQEVLDETPALLKPGSICKKCGREFVRGLAMHVKYCKG